MTQMSDNVPDASDSAESAETALAAAAAAEVAAQHAAIARPDALVDSVLMIDGDNDPHMPPDFVISERALVRVFLRQGAKMPRGLERRLGHLPFCVTVACTVGGANAADFVMSLHAGILHATLPMHLPFSVVTNDKSLSAICSELQRLGRHASLWTSHDKPSPSSRRSSRAGSETAAAGESASSRSRRGGRGRRRGGRSGSASGGRAAKAAPTAEQVFLAAEAAEKAAAKAEAAADTSLAAFEAAGDVDPKLIEVANSYAARLARIKDPPSRLKTLINDIANRTRSSKFKPEEIIEELKRSHGVSVDAQGRVAHPKKA